MHIVIICMMVLTGLVVFSARRIAAGILAFSVAGAVLWQYLSPDSISAFFLAVGGWLNSH